MEYNYLKNRDGRIDSLKGFLIILVVWGHTISDYGNGSLNEATYIFIYLFHMPLFVFISGLFTRNRSSMSDFWKRDIIKLAIPFVIFQAVSIILALVIYKMKMWNSMLITPYWVLWYLLSLMWWRMIVHYLSSFLLHRPVLCLIVSILLSLVSGIIPYGKILALQKTLAFLPFFLYGYYVGHGKMRFPKVTFIIRSFSVLLIGGMMVFIADNFHAIRSLLWDMLADSYGLNLIPVKIVMFFISSVLSISFFFLISENRLLALIGRDSLFYYLYHAVVIRFLLVPFLNYYNFPRSSFFVLLYVSFVFVVLFLIRRNRFIRGMIDW